MKYPLLLLVMIFPAALVFAQRDVELVFKPPKRFHTQKSLAHLYDQIDFLDSRSRPAIGAIATGLLKNNDGVLVLRQPVKLQLMTIMDTLLTGPGLATGTSSSGHGELLFQLRKFNYVEASATRFCYLTATLYSRNDDRYRKLLTMDTVFIIKDGAIEADLAQDGWFALTDFIRTGLTERPADTTSYSLYDLGRMDSIEQHRLPLYTDTVWVDGLYRDYNSFCQQRPDLQCMVKLNKKGEMRSVKVLGPDGKVMEQKPRDVYAVVYQGQAYIATEYGFYPLMRTESDLLFTGDVRVPASASDLNGAGFMLGLTGRLIASQGYRTTYTMVIDHLSGDFVHLRLIPPPATN